MPLRRSVREYNRALERTGRGLLAYLDSSFRNLRRQAISSSVRANKSRSNLSHYASAIASETAQDSLQDHLRDHSVLRRAWNPLVIAYQNLANYHHRQRGAP